MKPEHLSRVKLEGYKSIKECDLELRAINVLIGPNGAGKSNFVGFFRLVQQMLERNLQRYIGKNGGPDAFLFHGRKRTHQLKAQLHFAEYGYSFAMEPTVDNRMMISEEATLWSETKLTLARIGQFEVDVRAENDELPRWFMGFPRVQQWRVYHFHDTGDSAGVKQSHSIVDNEYLRPDARNLAAFLFRLKNHHADAYERIVKTVRLAAPFFGDFHLRRGVDNADRIELEWTELGEDEPFKAHYLSDGTLRFICLATVFLQPEEFQPETILVDEPELGLHPYAIKLLGSMIRSASKEKQVIISTQSVTLLNEFEPGDVIVADRKEGASVFRRVGEGELTEWLKEYTLGELWEKNILGGRPGR